MLQRVITILFDFVLSLVHLYTVPQLIGFALTSSAVIFISLRRGDIQRFFRRAFRTDLAYSAWFPVYTVLIGIPLSLRLAGFVTHYAPFLRIGVFSNLPAWANIPLFFIANDFVLYWLHRSLHQSRWLWAVHKIHHSQQELNSLTTWRVHWLEFVYLNIGAFTVGLFLGNMKLLHPVVIGLLAASQFAQHSDIEWTYGPVGRVIVSPRFHARHHSAAPEDINVNFGSLLIIWDHLFGTARKTPGRPLAYGLVAAQDNVPPSFLRQQFYPFLYLWRSALRSCRAKFNQRYAPKA
ncbi:MAG TPA: sterol desaturase family protein [Pyrinomonadaceae bacterium]|nr:sterol desaturase family protein [Pyrinomonadaceae bacterium]